MNALPCVITAVDGMRTRIPGAVHTIRTRRPAPEADIVKHEIYADIDRIREIVAGKTLVRVDVCIGGTYRTIRAYITTAGTLLEF